MRVEDVHGLPLPAPPPSDDGSDSPASGTRLSAVGTTSHPFGPKLLQAVWFMAEEFSNTSTLLNGFYEAKLNKGRIAALTIEALMQRCMSPAPTRNVAKNVSGHIQFSLETRGESNPTGVALTGDTSAAPHTRLSRIGGRTWPYGTGRRINFPFHMVGCHRNLAATR